MNIHRNSILFLVLLMGCSLLATTMGDNFAIADTNHDGNLDRKEFATYLHKVDTNMQKMLEVPADLVADVTAQEPQGFDWTFSTGGKDLTPSTMNTLLVILVTELGDKTFFIAAIMAMRYGRMVVYTGAMGALGLMHVLSCLMGIALPNILPREYTHFASAILFLYFGYKLMREAYETGDGPSEELQEAEEEMGKEKGEEDYDEESGKKTVGGSGGAYAADLAVLTQAFTVTFLAEWGDRSQIATIGLAASKNVYGVIIGGLIGHAFCTGLAVVGGKYLAAKISPKSVGYIGGVTFLLFGVFAFFEDPHSAVL